MKKLMFAAAAMTAGIAMADVSSANIVGYQNVDNVSGYSLQVATFLKVGDEGVDIQSMVPVMSEDAKADLETDDLGSGLFDLQIFDENGGTAEGGIYCYCTPDGDGVSDGAGWYPFNVYDKKADFTFEPGAAFMLNNSTGYEAWLTHAGEVELDERTVDAPSGYFLLGNFRPVAISIQDILPVMSEDAKTDLETDDLGSGLFDLQFFDENGGTAEGGIYCYCTPDGDGVSDGAGWYPFNVYDEKADRELVAGEGFMLNNSTGYDGWLTFSAYSTEK